MYTPPHFRIEDEGVLFDLIDRHPLGLLITGGPAGLLANPVPMVLDRSQRTLRGHVARANPVWREFGASGPVLAVFQGPDHYVSPSWYASKSQTGKVVPTWNYMMVQVRGQSRAVEDPVWLRALVSELTDRHEAGRPEPWKVADAPDDYLDSQIRGIVGFEIAITALDGKFKVSQNRAPSDQAGVERALEQDGALTEVVEYMRRRRRKD
jgi:transcriptional regulator